jgi:hypothetical protein
LLKAKWIFFLAISWLEQVAFQWYGDDVHFTKWRGGRVMVFNTTFNNISVILRRSILLVKETGVPGENHRPAASHWQTLSYDVVSSTPCHEQDLNSQPIHTHIRVRVMLVVEYSTVKCRTAIKFLFLYFKLCLSVMLDSLSCSFTSISFLTISCSSLRHKLK